MPMWVRGGWSAVLGLALLTRAAAAADAPKAVDESVFDFGSVARGARVEHIFRLPNRGQATLHIDHVKGSCGCTVGVVSAREVPPGDEGRVAVTLDTTRLAGRTTKVMSVYTDDPAHPVMPLTLTGTVVADLVIEPTALYLGRVRRGETVHREVTIVPGGPTAYTVTSIDSPSPSLHVRLEPRDGGLPGQRLIIELARSVTLGHFSEEIRLHTTSPTDPVMTLMVFGTVEGDVVVLPPQVSFGVTQASAAPEREVFIRTRGAQPFAVTRVAVPDDLVTYELSPLDPGREYRLRLRLRDGVRPGKVEGSVEIFTDHPDEERLVVPLYAIVRAASGRRG